MKKNKKIILILLLLLLIFISGILIIRNNKDINKKENNVVNKEYDIAYIIKTDDLETFMLYEKDMETVNYDDILKNAISNDSIEIVEYILNKNIKINVLDNINYDTAMELAIQSQSKKSFDVLYEKNYINGKKLIYYALQIEDDYYLKKLLGKSVVIDNATISLIKSDDAMKEKLFNNLSDEEINDVNNLIENNTNENETEENNTENNTNENGNNTGGSGNNTGGNKPDDTIDNKDKIYFKITTTPDVEIFVNNTNEYFYQVNPTILINGSTINYSIKNKPDFLYFDSTTGKLFGTPRYEDIGVYENIIITVSSNNQVEEIIFDLVVAFEEGQTYFEITNSPSTESKVKNNYVYEPTINLLSEDATLKYSVENLPDFLTFDNNTGKISGTPGYGNDGVYENIKITVSSFDQVEEIIFDLKVNISNVETAILNADASYTTKEEILDRLNYTTNIQKEKCVSTLTGIFGDNYKSFALPSSNNYWNTYLYSNDNSHIPVLYTDANTIYGLIGELEGVEYFLTGLYFLRNDLGTDLNSVNFDINLIKYLTKNPDFFNTSQTIYFNSPFHNANVVTAYFDSRGIDRSNITVNTNNTNFNNGNYSLAVFMDPTNAQIDRLIANKKPFIILYNDSNDSNRAYNRFNVSMNFHATRTVNTAGSIEAHCNQFSTSSASVVNTLLNKQLKLTNISTACGGELRTACDFNVLQDQSGEKMSTLLTSEIDRQAGMINRQDVMSLNIFDTKDEVSKLMLLYADKIRETVVFPMSHLNSNHSDFYNSYFADLLINYSRDNNKAQNDVGDFAADYSKINTFELETVTLNLNTYSYGETHVTGYYLKPGQKLVVTRLDNSKTYVGIKLNNQKQGSERIFDPGKSYYRPLNIQSNTIPLKSGVEYTISSPHGGNIYIETANASDSTKIQIKLENVLSYPILTKFDETSITDYVNEIYTTPYNFTDIDTPYVSIHSKKGHMLKAISDYNNDGVLYLEDLQNYMINATYKYAGYSNEDIGYLDQDIVDYFMKDGLVDYNNQSIHAISRRQHINVDTQASCGALCAFLSSAFFDSGNALLPKTWGPNHEMGHLMQNNLLKIYTGRSTESSNNIFPMNIRYLEAINAGSDTYLYGQLQGAKELFTQANAEFIKGTAPSVNHAIWSGSGTYDNTGARLGVYLQFIFISQDWNLYPKLYITQRLFSSYRTTDAQWDLYKDALGFSSYTRTEVNSINPHDFMLIAISNISSRDFSNIFTGYGINITDKAKAQVLLNNPQNATPNAGMFYIPSDTISVNMPSYDNFIEFGAGVTWKQP